MPVPPVLTPHMLYHIDTVQGCLTLSLCLAPVSMPESEDESSFEKRKLYILSLSFHCVKKHFSSGLLFSLARGTLEEQDSTGVRG